MSGDALDISGDALEPAVSIPPALWRDIFAEARRAFPNECCGWLTGPRGGAGVTGIRPCDNVQDTGSSQIQGRTAETAYAIEGKDLLELNHAFDTDTPPRVIYHSHPNGRAYFSDTDQRVALSPWGDGPAYDVQHLVVGIDSERVTEAALFVWSENAAAYVEIARFPGPDAAHA